MMLILSGTITSSGISSSWIGVVCLDPGGGSGGGGSGGGDSDDCKTKSHWDQQAQDRLPYEKSNLDSSDASDRDKIVERGWAISGAYADLYLRDTANFMWAGMAAWVSSTVTTFRDTMDTFLDAADSIQDFVNSLPDDIESLYDTNAEWIMEMILIAITLVVLSVEDIVDILKDQFWDLWDTITDMVDDWINDNATIEEIIQDIIDFIKDIIDSILNYLLTLFDFLTDVNEGIYEHAVWAFLAYDHGGYDCVEELTPSSHDGRVDFRAYFNAMGTSPTESEIEEGVKRFFTSEQVAFGQKVYDNYPEEYIEPLTSTTFAFFGFQSSELLRIFSDDIESDSSVNEDPNIYIAQQRNIWSSDHLTPKFRQFAHQTWDTVDTYMPLMIDAGCENGASTYFDSSC